MHHALIIKLKDGRSIIINEEAVSSALPVKEGMNILTELRMDNGDVWMCVEPHYQAWENDALKRKD